MLNVAYLKILAWTSQTTTVYKTFHFELNKTTRCRKTLQAEATDRNKQNALGFKPSDYPLHANPLSHQER